MSETYNGWTNYATWRINLEVFDGLEPNDLGCFSRYKEPDLTEVADYLSDYVHNILGETEDSLTLSYARAFVSDVNWHEIARHFVEAWTEQMQEENQDD